MAAADQVRGERKGAAASWSLKGAAGGWSRNEGRGEGQLERIGQHLSLLGWLWRTLMRPHLHQQGVLRIVGSAVDFDPSAIRQGPPPRTLEATMELPFKKVEHQALGSTLFGAVASKAVDRQRLGVGLLRHISAPWRLIRQPVLRHHRILNQTMRLTLVACREGFEPPTARSVGWRPASIWSVPDGKRLLRWGVPSDHVGSGRVQSDRLDDQRDDQAPWTGGAALLIEHKISYLVLCC
jgi:hypothetical protein